MYLSQRVPLLLLGRDFLLPLNSRKTQASQSALSVPPTYVYLVRDTFCAAGHAATDTQQQQLLYLSVEQFLLTT